MGTTLAILSRSGTTPVVKERLNICVSGPTMTSETSLSILELMLSFHERFRLIAIFPVAFIIYVLTRSFV